MRIIDPTTTPAWARLTELKASYVPDLRGSFAGDPDRAVRLTRTCADLHVDLSKNLIGHQATHSSSTEWTSSPECTTCSPRSTPSPGRCAMASGRG